MNKIVILGLMVVFCFTACTKESLEKSEKSIINYLEESPLPEEDNTQQRASPACNNRSNKHLLYVAGELNRVANCGVSECTLYQQELYYDFAPLEEWCWVSYDPCIGCADGIEDHFTVAAQDEYIAQAQDLADGIQLPCGSNAEIHYIFSIDYGNCICGAPNCSANAFMNVSIRVRCCLN